MLMVSKDYQQNTETRPGFTGHLKQNVTTRRNLSQTRVPSTGADPPHATKRETQAQFAMSLIRISDTTTCN